MRVLDLIDKKREGGSHTREELEALVLGYTRGDVPDYQMSAWLMAVCWRGMTDEETLLLTRVMAASGEQLDLSGIGRTVADKHSTGGVGDKTSLVVMPLVAACGVPVGKMSGRGLGFTGGTVDKLESFAGYRADVSAPEFLRLLGEVGAVIVGQSADLAPADGKLYALRDASATVRSLPLIASSIMSKKLAAGAGAILLDVKTGAGAFMRELAEAHALAVAMVQIGRQAGRRTAAVVSDMSQPLGRSVGNALEVAEALDTLEGRGPPELESFCVELASQLVALATDGARGRAEVDEALRSGAGLAKLREMVSAQGGDTAAFDDRSALPTARHSLVVRSRAAGFVERLDAMAAARAAGALGASREKKGDAIDLAVGVILAVKVGSSLGAGDPIATLYANDASLFSPAEALLRDGLSVSPSPVPVPPLILERIGV